MKKFVLCNLFILCVLALFAQEKPVKNVIVMIPDGTSTSLISAARWYQTYLDPTKTTLNLDPYFCGLVRTNSSDAPIGDSAPTTSCYMTGQPTQTGFVSTYPQQTDHDLVPVDASKAYQPLATILEAAKQIKNMSTGLVFTCEFPHATPADCAAHTYKRSCYEMIAPQMVHNNVDVVIGGGTKYLSETDQQYLKNQGYSIYLDDLKGMRDCTKAPFWALFSPKSMPYDMERDATRYPSLAEMTRKAIKSLQDNPDGFFLMVEGSKVDWAAHNNDAMGAIHDFLAFDEACKEAFDFAQKDGQTLVIVLPDHGTSALTIGSSFCGHGYDKMSLQQIMQPIADYKLSLDSMSKLMKAVDTSQWPSLLMTYYNYEVQSVEIQYLNTASDYNKSDLPKDQRAVLSLDKLLSQVLYGKTCIGFTTFGHTGENVFLANYHPNGDRLTGCHTNVEVNEYICHQMGLDGALQQLTEDIYADHHEVFKDYQVTIDSLDKYNYRLTVNNNKTKLVVDSYTNYVTVNGRRYDLASVIVYMPINKTFYLPKNLDRYLYLK